MKVYSSIGSKERFQEMFQRINKIKLNEDINSGLNIIEEKFNELKNDGLNIKDTNSQTTGNENIIKIIANDNNGAEITFTFRLIGIEDNQDGVVNIDNAELINFTYNNGLNKIDMPEGMNSLNDFNLKFRNIIPDVVGEYANFENSPTFDSDIEEAINIIDNIKENQIDVEDDVLAMPTDYGDNYNLDNEEYDDVDKSYMGIFNTQNSNEIPSQEPENDDDLNISHMAQGKKRVYPAWADKYLPEQETVDVKKVTSNYFNNLTPDFKNKIIQNAAEALDYRLGADKFRMSKDEYRKLVKELSQIIYSRYLTDVNETEYPKQMEIAKDIEPKKKYPEAQKKRHKVKKLKISEEQDEVNIDIEDIAKAREEQGDQIKGGLGDDKSPLDFSAEQIKKGMAVEMEHTDDPMIALEITLDHLTENPEYYTVKDNPEDSAQFGAASDAEKINQNEIGDNETPEGEENVFIGHDSENSEDGNIQIGMEHNMDTTTGTNMAHPHDKTDDETDILLGYKPKNVGDIDENIVGAQGAESIVNSNSEQNNMNDDDIRKFQDYEKKDFNSLLDNEKEEYFELWKKSKNK